MDQLDTQPNDEVSTTQTARIRNLERSVSSLQREMKEMKRQVFNIQVLVDRCRSSIAIIERGVANIRRTANEAITTVNILTKRK